jgi:hypothetical protein
VSWSALGIWMLWLGCDGGDAPPPPPTSGPEPAAAVEVPAEPLPDALLLRRISLDLRGELPSLAELDRVEGDPDSLDALIDDFLDDDRWEERLVDLFAEQWLTRVDWFNVSEDDYHLDSSLAFEFNRSVGEEPLRLMAHVARTERPWTEIVTADYTMANELLAEVWDLEYPDGASGWQESRYRDSRPAGGVVMTNGLWWRYYTTPNNFSRSRAAAMTRLLLCDDYLLRPISFEAPALLTREDLNEATREVPGCTACHSTLDPLASALFGFWWFDLYDAAEMTTYHAEREGMGEDYLGLEPAWFGVPIEGAAQLGAMLAADDRFRSCTVRRMAQGLWRRDPDLADFTTLEVLEQGFEDSDLRLNALVRDLLAGPNYRAGTLTDDAQADDELRLTTRRVMSTEQFADTLLALTGFSWTWDGYELLANDEHGYRILAGGLDGIDVTSPASDPTLTRSLVIKRLAQVSAAHVVQTELVDGAEPTLFTEVDLAALPGEASFSRQLDHLHRRLTGETPGAARLALDEALWTDVETLSDPAQAWTSLLTGLLRDPAFWTY